MPIYTATTTHRTKVQENINNDYNQVKFLRKSPFPKDEGKENERINPRCNCKREVVCFQQKTSATHMDSSHNLSQLPTLRTPDLLIEHMN